MRRSFTVAEKTTIEGEVTDFDTQQCNNLQQQILSSSPAHTRTPDRVAPALDAIINPSATKSPAASATAEANRTREVTYAHPGYNEPPPTAPLLFYRRERPRAFTPHGRESTSAEFLQKVQRQKRMDDLTQKSSMSLTQENPEEVYEQFELRKRSYDYSSTETPGKQIYADGENRTQLSHSLYSPNQHASRTQSTAAHTYHEDDTGHITLELNTDAADTGGGASQDEGFTDSHVEASSSQHEPQTPAQPVNPFKNRGSVMKGMEMFGATQPSSLGRHFASPTSSRPSPRIYNAISSPTKPHTLGLETSSSPAGLVEMQETSTSPLQSSVRKMMQYMSSIPDPMPISKHVGSRSFPRPSMRLSGSLPGPRPYVSMKESQERRRASEAARDPDSDSGGSDISITAVAKIRTREAKQQMQRDMERVRMPLSSRLGYSGRSVSSSKRASSTAAPVEVPSTEKRRRSVEEYCTAQYSGHDARDTHSQRQTQPDDFIADSQALPVYDEPTQSDDGANDSQALNHHRRSAMPPNKTAQAQTSTAALALLATNPAEDLSSGEGLKVTSTNSTDSADPEGTQPSLPLQELSSNLPIVSGFHAISDNPETVPETSPLPSEDHFRPIGDIATISFSERDDHLADLPGFTQDAEFQRAMDAASSPQLSPSASESQSRSHSRRLRRFEAMSIPQAPLFPSISTPAPAIDAVATKEAKLVTSAKMPSAIPIKEQPATEPGREEQVQVATGSDDHRSPPEKRSHTAQENTHSNDAVGPVATSLITHRSDTSVPDKTSTNTSTTEGSANTSAGLVCGAPGPHPGRGGLRTASELRGPSRSLRRSINLICNPPAPSPKVSTPGIEPEVTSQKRSRIDSSVDSSPLSTPKSTPLASSWTPDDFKTLSAPYSLGKTPAKRTAKNKITTRAGKEPAPTRSSKRQFIAHVARDESEDPLALPSTMRPKIGALFENMVFAVSYVGHESEKDKVLKIIRENGGKILDDGFDSLFEVPKAKTGAEDMSLKLTKTAKILGFTALIADESSRKSKYMQALALGFPCLSGYWITSCFLNKSIVDWTPYLLCAGKSSTLGDAHRSRFLKPYSAIDARLADVFAEREKLLGGKSVMVVVGKGRSADNRKAYLFLTRALGPARVVQAADSHEARKTLLEFEAQGQDVDMLYADGKEKAAKATELAVFGTGGHTGSGTRKRKRGPAPIPTIDEHAPKKIRVINDESMIESLILGQFLQQ